MRNHVRETLPQRDAVRFHLDTRLREIVAVGLRKRAALDVHHPARAFVVADPDVGSEIRGDDHRAPELLFIS